MAKRITMYSIPGRKPRCEGRNCGRPESPLIDGLCHICRANGNVRASAKK